MNNVQTYAVVDTDTGTLTGYGLTREEATALILLNTSHCANLRYETYREAPSLEIAFYDKAADAYSNAAEAYADHDKEAEEAFVKESRLWNKIAYDYELATQHTNS